MEITIVFDNLVEKGRWLTGGNGFSCIIKSKSENIMFDTGKGRETFQNMVALGINPDEIKQIVISHGHYDHTGGLYWMDPKGKKLVCHKSFFNLQIKNGRYIGPPISYEAARSAWELEEVEGVAEIADGVFVMNKVEKLFEEDISKGLSDGTSDPFYYEIYLVIPYEAGLMLITGCSHRGIRNAVVHAEKVFGKKVRAVLGGLHLVDRDAEFIDKISSFFTENSINVIGCHCTGTEGKNALSKKLNGSFIEGSVGKRIKIRGGMVHVERHSE